MSKSTDKIGSVVRSLVSVPKKHLGLLLDISNKFGGTDGEAWHIALKAQLKAGPAQVVQPQLTAVVVVPTNTQHAFIQRIYNKYFPGLKVTVPTFPDREGKVGIHVAQGLTCDMVWDAFNFPKWKWMNGSIDAQLGQTREARKPSEGSYTVYVRNGVEPDSQHLGKSTNQTDPNGNIGVTLLERMLLGLMYHEQTGKHLDVKGVTFCSGSRYHGGNVPGVYLGTGGNVDVGRYHPGYSSPRYGVRSAVTL